MRQIARIAGTAPAAGLVVTVVLMFAAPVDHVVLVTARQSVCGATALCPTDPAPDGGDQGSAERKIIDGYIAKQKGCTPELTPNPQSVAWDPPGFTPYVGGSGMINDADPRLGGQFRADWVNGGWHIEYMYC